MATMAQEELSVVGETLSLESIAGLAQCWKLEDLWCLNGPEAVTGDGVED